MKFLNIYSLKKINVVINYEKYFKTFYNLLSYWLTSNVRFTGY